MSRLVDLIHRAGVPVALLAASLLLHGLLVSGVAGRLGVPVPRATPGGAAVEVALLVPPAPSAPVLVAPAAAPRAEVAAAVPRLSRAQPRPRVDALPAGRAPGEPEPMPAPGLLAAADGTAAVPSPPLMPATPQPASVQPATPQSAEPEPPPEPMNDASVPPPAAAPVVSVPRLPGSRRERFRVYWGEFTKASSVARLEYLLVNDGDRYLLRTQAEAEGLLSLVYSGTLTQSSAGRLGPAGLQPVRYAETRGRRPERAVAFDLDAGRLLAGDREPLPLPAGTQDRLSVFYQIGLLARAEPARFVAGAVFDLPVATMREVRTERFVVIGPDVLMAPGGPIHALHFARVAPPGTEEPRIDLWLGYDFEMLPVRLRIEDVGGRVLDQVIDRGG
jgi:hypothetical protein